MSTPFQETHNNIILQGPIGAIEVSTSVPKNATIQKAVLICHPHPLHGGTMNNKVVTTLMRTFDSLGFYTVRFNFRGVGQSEGEHDHGIGESEDCVFLLQWLQQTLPDAELYLAGFSFGSYVAYKVATTSRFKSLIKTLVLIAPPAIYPEFADLPEPAMPWIVIQGEADEVIPPHAVFTWLESFTKGPQLIRMPDTSHFFHGKLVDLKNALIKALQ